MDYLTPRICGQDYVYWNPEDKIISAGILSTLYSITDQSQRCTPRPVSPQYLHINTLIFILKSQSIHIF